MASSSCAGVASGLPVTVIWNCPEISRVALEAETCCAICFS
jgi:hypothetical protein